MSGPPIVVGTGFVALDVVLGSGPRPLVLAGGSCGNVLVALARDGWIAIPAAPLGPDAASRRIRSDLARFGVETRWLDLPPSRLAPVVVERVEGGRHSFSRRCPGCGGPLPRHVPLDPAAAGRVADAAGAARVLYVDRACPASIELARTFAARGALVFYEPFDVRPPELARDVLRLAHAVKYSRERLAGLEELLPERDLLEIATLGAAGLRWRRGRGQPWSTLPAPAAGTVVDAAGCGDWCTAGFLDRVGRGGAAGFADLPADAIAGALEHGQSLAAWNLGFEGARGGMYAPGDAGLEVREPLCPSCPWPLGPTPVPGASPAGEC